MSRTYRRRGARHEYDWLLRADALLTRDGRRWRALDAASIGDEHG